MDFSRFVSEVQEQTFAKSPQESDAIIRGTLATLGDRLVGGAPDDLAAQLPEEIGRWLLNQENVRVFGVDEFYDRVADRAGVQVEEARRGARVVMKLIAKLVTRGVMDKIRAQLPPEYDELFAGNIELREDDGRRQRP